MNANATKLACPLGDAGNGATRFRSTPGCSQNPLLGGTSGLSGLSSSPAATASEFAALLSAQDARDSVRWCRRQELTRHSMENPTPRSAHTFHIPVLGTGFSIDTALRVARYGISSVISLLDDGLIEQIRGFHCEREGETYEEIADRDEDSRARRITAYLNLVDRLVSRQVATLQASPFVPRSEITRYYEMLPQSPLRQTYKDMLASREPQQKAEMQDRLRRMAVPGSTDVNVMSKCDRDLYRSGRKLPVEFSDAMAALRGYANSSLRSSIVFSAGMNPRLYGYVAQHDDFLPDSHGVLKKKIVLKVSDYRSAVIQGKFLAKRGLWVSEYRIESSLNCGGHAFATKGFLLGPILEEFKQQRSRLTRQLHALYVKALAAAGRSPIERPHETRITVQGGIGTADENALLLDYYGVDGTGWATPFLLVREATNLDDEHLEKLAAATHRDVYLSDSSPLGIPFWNLRNSASEEDRRRRIRQNRPGRPCLKGCFRLNTEFTEVSICTASRDYQKRKLPHLPEEGLTAEQFPLVRERVLAKSCICHDLGGGATIRYGIDPDATPAVCPGPSITDFSKIATLEETVSHIYGRVPLPMSPDRPHMFIREIALYADYLRDEIEWCSSRLLSHSENYFDEFKENLLSGIEYYRGLAQHLDEQQRQRFLYELRALHETIESILLVTVE